MTLNPRQFGALHQQLVEKGGYTVNPKTGHQPSSGWMVGRAGTEGSFPLPGSGSDIQHHTEQYGPQIQKAGHMGGWTYQGEGVLNATKRFDNTSRGMQRAVRSMNRQKETAIYEPRSDTTYWSHPSSPEEHAENQKATGHFLDQALRDLGQS